MVNHKNIWQAAAVKVVGMLLLPFFLWALNAPITPSPYPPGIWSPGGTEWSLGATMYVSNDGDSIFARFIYSAAAWGNVLYFMDPSTGQQVRVFGFDECNRPGQCPIDSITGQIVIKRFLGVFNRFDKDGQPVELVFNLQTKVHCFSCNNVCDGTECGPRYTGLNNPLISEYYSTGAYSSLQNHAWAVMGEFTQAAFNQVLANNTPCGGITQTPANAGGVVFSYEDGCNVSYNDMAFAVEGATLVRPRLPAPSASPPTTTFTFDTLVTLSHLFGGSIFYNIDGGPWQQFTGSPIRITSRTAIRAYAVSEGWQNSDTISEVYTPIDGKSSLVLQKADGSLISSLTELTQNDGRFLVNIYSPTPGLEGVGQPVSYSAKRGDRETFTTDAGVHEGNVVKLADEIAFDWNQTAVPGNNVLDVAPYDTITVTWTNPTNASDAVSGTVAIRPAAQPSAICLSLTLNGPCLTADDSLSVATTSFFVIVQDQIFKPGLSYTVTLSNVPGARDAVDVDILTLGLTATGTPGKYYAQVPLDAASPVAGDNRLQAMVGNQIKAEYTDPVDGDNATAQIGFGIKSERSGDIRFTDGDYSTGPTLIDNTWPISNGAVYLVFTDDALNAGLDKQCSIVVKNNWPLGSATDIEVVTLVNQGGGVWRAPVALSDSKTALPYDSTLQVYFNSVITAYVSTHQNTPDREVVDGRDEAILHAAYSNLSETITVRDRVTGGLVTRHTTEVDVCVTDQIYSQTTLDTLVLSSVECPGAGDRIASTILLTQASATDSVYCGSFPKTEGGGTPNEILECLDIDIMTFTYLDVVYNSGITKDVPIADPFVNTIEFLDAGRNSITTAGETIGTNQVIVRVTTRDNTIGAADDTTITLTTAGGDQETITLHETGTPGVYEGVFSFGFTTAPVPGDGVIQGHVVLGNSQNRETLTATLGNTSSQLELSAAYIPANRAWIVDGDGDGRGDTVYIEFAAQLPARTFAELAVILGSVSDIDWPAETSGAGVTAMLDPAGGFFEIGIDSASGGKRVYVIPGGDAFPQDATAQGLPAPTLRLPVNSIFQGQEVIVSDRIGPVVVRAFKAPSNLSAYDDTTTSSGGEPTYVKKTVPDTLDITFSERFETGAGFDWNTLLQFTLGGCGDGLKVYPLLLTGSPAPITPDSLTWQFYVSYDYVRPGVSDCIFMNPASGAADLLGNRPEPKGQNVEGSDPVLTIKFTGVLNAVEGSGYNIPRSSLVFGSDPFGSSPDQFQPAWDPAYPEQNIPLKDAYGNDRRVKFWFPPAGFDPVTLSVPAGGALRAQCGSAAAPLEAEGTLPVMYPPRCISAVYVYTLKPYVASIQIFDHYGTFIQSSTQQFGYCGEMDNDERNYPKGWLSYLVWDLKDRDGQYVKNGVYIWKVTFITEGENSFTNYYRQGTAFEQDPAENCAVDPQF